ncbi:hypothetical protein C6341_g6876 [Phytophthora cactorum]|nr:hypothetical protein C6341_g6876 [Phytophthora cactorum]
MVVRHETRSKKIAFAERLTQVHVGTASVCSKNIGPSFAERDRRTQTSRLHGQHPRDPSVTKPSATGAKPRKKSAATLAKEARVAAAAAKRSAAAKVCQDQASDAQKKGKEVKKAARKRLKEAKGKKRMADTKASAEPKKRRTFPHETTQGGCDSRTESPSSDRSTADATHSSTPEPAQTHTAQTTPGASIVQPLVGPVPAADEESGDALDSECDEEEEEMMFDYVSASEDTTPPLPSEITESDDSPDESSPAVVADNDALMNEDTDFDWPILESEELLDFAKDEAELAKTRKTGWYLDPDEFPPDQRYPGLYDDPSCEAVYALSRAAPR